MSVQSDSDSVLSELSDVETPYTVIGPLVHMLLHGTAPGSDAQPQFAVRRTALDRLREYAPEDLLFHETWPQLCEALVRVIQGGPIADGDTDGDVDGDGPDGADVSAVEMSVAALHWCASVLCPGASPEHCTDVVAAACRGAARWHDRVACMPVSENLYGLVLSVLEQLADRAYPHGEAIPDFVWADIGHRLLLPARPSRCSVLQALGSLQGGPARAVGWLQTAMRPRNVRLRLVRQWRRIGLWCALRKRLAPSSGALASDDPEWEGSALAALMLACAAVRADAVLGELKLDEEEEKAAGNEDAAEERNTAADPVAAHAERLQQVLAWLARVLSALRGAAAASPVDRLRVERAAGAVALLADALDTAWGLLDDDALPRYCGGDAAAAAGEGCEPYGISLAALWALAANGQPSTGEGEDGSAHALLAVTRLLFRVLRRLRAAGQRQLVASCAPQVMQLVCEDCTVSGTETEDSEAGAVADAAGAGAACVGDRLTPSALRRDVLRLCAELVCSSRAELDVHRAADAEPVVDVARWSGSAPWPLLLLCGRLMDAASDPAAAEAAAAALCDQLAASVLQYLPQPRQLVALEQWLALLSEPAPETASPVRADACAVDAVDADDRSERVIVEHSVADSEAVALRQAALQRWHELLSDCASLADTTSRTGALLTLLGLDTLSPRAWALLFDRVAPALPAQAAVSALVRLLRLVQALVELPPPHVPADAQAGAWLSAAIESAASALGRRADNLVPVLRTLGQHACPYHAYEQMLTGDEDASVSVRLVALRAVVTLLPLRPSRDELAAAALFPEQQGGQAESGHGVGPETALLQRIAAAVLEGTGAGDP